MRVLSERRLAVELGALAGTPRVYQSTINRDHILRSRDRFAAQADDAGVETPEIDEESFGMPESVITAAVDVTPYLEYKRRAMRAHASQISEQSFFLAMPTRPSRTRSARNGSSARGRARASPRPTC